jgi:curli biogenesis system outer membrane secretion channel CsgG
LRRVSALWKALAAALLLCAALPAAAEQKSQWPASGQSRNDSAAAESTSYEAYYGPKQVIAVLPFENRVTNVYGAMNLGEGLSEILITELHKSGRFLLVERMAIQSIIKEQELGMTGLVNQETAPAVGQMSGAQFMVIGAVTEFNDEAGGGGLSIGYSGAEVGGKVRTAYVGIDVRLVDNATGQIYASYNANEKATSAGASLATSFSQNAEMFKIGASGFFSTALGEATRAAVQEVIGFILQESRNIPWQGSIVKSGSQTYVNRGENANVSVGDKFNVYSKGEPLIDPETGFNLGSDEQLICSMQVVDVRDKFSIASPGPECLAQGMKRGDIVRYQ